MKFLEWNIFSSVGAQQMRPAFILKPKSIAESKSKYA